MSNSGPQSGAQPALHGTLGPYLVRRDWSALAWPGRPVFLEASDHLTGLPALLQVLREVPQDFDPADVPASPALLPFSDYLPPDLTGLSDIVLVSELPLNAAAATNPLLAARGALTALHVLHAHGRAHGHLHPAQLWSVDGRVRLAGGGLYPLGQEWSLKRDLQDLARVLDALGGVPEPLQVLRDPPADFTAREALDRLNAAPTPAAEPGIRLPPPPVPLSVVPASAPEAAPEAAAATVPQPVAEALQAVPAAPQQAASPPAKQAASQAAERLRADAQRQRRLAELRARAVGAGAPGEVDVAEAEAAAVPAPSETPQQRRQREHAARLAEEKSSEAWRAEHPPEVRTVVAPEPEAAATEKRQIKPARFGWNSNEGKWHAVSDGERVPATSRPAFPLWLWPLLALLGVLLLVGLWRATHRAPASACCDVRFNVLGQGKSAQLSVQNAPAGAGWQPGRKLGNIPGVVHFPVAGNYRLNVTSPGFSPAALDVQVPAKRPLNVRLGP